jgi:aldehyde dehydrogenase (NAD+)
MEESKNKESLYKPTSPNSKLDFESVWDYAPAPESSDHVELKEKYDLFIGGKFVKPSKGRYFNSINPANEEKLAEVAEATQKDVDDAVKAARKAFNGAWGKMKASERSKYIFKLARMLQERAREFAVLESMDGGKPIRESRDVDIPLVAAHFFYYAGWADKLEYAFPGKKPKGLGVCGQIIPWNFPC